MYLILICSMDKTHHILEIPETQRKFYVPTELAYCNEREYVIVSRYLWLWTSGKINFEEFKVQCIYELLNLKKSKKQLNSIEEDFKNSNIYRVAQLLESFFNEIEEKKQIKQNYTKNHVPKFRTLFSLQYGPENEFNNVSFAQYEDGLNLYHLYSLDNDVELLYMLIATFYLPKGKKYDNKLTEKRAAKFKNIDFGIVYGFYLFFGAFQLYLTRSSVYYQGKEIDLSIIFSSDGSSFKSDLPDLGGKSIAYYLAKLDIFGEVTKVRTTNLWEAMLALYDIRKEHLDDIKKAEQQKNKSK